MALTNQQVQAAYLAIIGRPAEGSAVTWASGSFADLASLVSSIIDIRKGGDFENNKETFVENLYQNLLGRPSDAEGKEFWLKALNDGASYAQIAQGFINAVLSQSQTADLYNLQNKLDVAEKISAQVTNFQGGAAAEATLKSLMKDVNANTTIDSIQDSVDNFVGNSVNIKTVTINPADTDPAEIKGSAENATVFNLSLDVASENPSMQQELKGSTKFADTLNVKVTSSDKEAEDKLVANNLGTISNIKTLNITTDATITTTNLGAIDAGVKNINFTGKSNDTFSIGAADSVSTGAGNDTVTLTGAVKSVNLGAGNDTLIVNASQTTLTSVLGVENLNIANAVSLKASVLSGKDYNVTATGAGFVVDAKGASTIDLGSLTGLGTNPTVAINNVAKGASVTLANTSGAQTVKAAGTTATGLKIAGADTGDEIDLSAIGGIASYGAETATAWAGAAAIVTKKFSFVAQDVSSTNAVATTLTNIGKNGVLNSDQIFAAAGGEGLVAFKGVGAETAYIYLINDINADKKLTANEVTLLASVNADALVVNTTAIGNADGIITL